MLSPVPELDSAWYLVEYRLGGGCSGAVFQLNGLSGLSETRLRILAAKPAELTAAIDAEVAA